MPTEEAASKEKDKGVEEVTTEAREDGYLCPYCKNGWFSTITLSCDKCGAYEDDFDE